MEAKALEKSLKPRFSLPKASLLYLVIALVLGGINLYAYISGSFVPMEIMEEENLVLRDLTGTMRNLFFVRVATIALCIYLMWKNSKNYNSGFSFPENRWAFVGSILLTVFTVLFLLVKISWVQNFVNHGLILLFFVISDAFFIALGVFLMRAANAPKIFRVLVPVVGNLLVYATMFAGLVWKKMGYYQFADIKNTLIFFAILTVFMLGFYLLTHRMLVAVIFGCLWSYAVATYRHPVITTLSLSKWIALGGAAVLAAVGVIGIVVYMIQKKPLSEKIADYVAPDAGFGINYGTDVQTVLHSSKSVFLAVIAFFVVFGTIFTTSWDQISEASIALLDFLETLIKWNFRSSGESTFNSQVLYSKFLELWSVLSLLPILLLGIAFLYFYISREQMQANKIKIGWIFAKIAMACYVIINALIGLVVLKFSMDGVFDKLPEATYSSNYLLSIVAEFDFLGWMGTAVIVGIAILLIYTIVMLVLTWAMSKNNQQRPRKLWFYPVAALTALVGLPSLALAFWFNDSMQVILGIMQAAFYFIILSMLCSIYGKKRKEL
ncbi:MAG: hypothetical protein E7637_01665 [Ruminococcaceae bacterium]|nr:hypothetical protein [Oscillospiraceae bacterium]